MGIEQRGGHEARNIEDKARDEASRIYEQYLDAKWTRQKGDGDEEIAWKSTVRAVNRMERRYPEVYDEVLINRGPEKARHFFERFFERRVKALIFQINQN